MKNLMNMLEQAKGMKSWMDETRKAIEVIEVEGVSGAGAVTLILSGDRVLRRLKIDPSILGDVGIVEDLVTAAHNDAIAKLEARLEEEAQKMIDDLPLPPLPPGMKFPF